MHQPDLYTTSYDVKLAIYTWGTPPTPEHPKEVLLFAHGFPDRALFWEKVALELQHDFYVVAFDMRGCANSTHIKGCKHYKFEPLIQDLFAVIDAVSPYQKVHVVGHDWGGIYTWNAVQMTDGIQRIASLTTMSPSLEQVGIYLRKRLLKPTPKNLWQLMVQLLRNSLMMFFALPILPDVLWRSGLGVVMLGWIFKWFEPQGSLKKNEGVAGDAVRYLGIYRANLLQRVLPAKRFTVSVPVHLLLAQHDPFLPPALFEQPEQWANQVAVSYVDAAHWAPLSRPVELATAIRQYLNK